MTLRVLTASDLHRSGQLYRELIEAVDLHKPDVVALVGDSLGLDVISQSNLLSVKHAARVLSGLSAPHVIFVRGNHEQEEWQEFVHAWPFEERPLVAIYGSVFTVGPLSIVGFPCHLGWEGPWCETLPKIGNELTLDHSLSGRKPLPVRYERWLPQLLRQIGPAGRTLWLMHQPPATMPIATPQAFDPAWTDAIQRFRPLLVVSGHDHETPKRFNAWHTRLGDTLCVNPGQNGMDLHYSVLDFEFASDEPDLPRKVTIQAFPWNSRIVLPSS